MMQTGGTHPGHGLYKGEGLHMPEGYQYGDGYPEDHAPYTEHPRQRRVEGGTA